MAKQKPEGANAAPQSPEQAAAEAAAPKKERKAPQPAMRVGKFVFKADPPEGSKIAPQAAIIVKHVKAAGADGITKEALEKSLANDAEFKTRQPILRIVGYYQRPLVELGVLAAA